jgi:lipopolysaccharide biosynthesis protein
MQSVCFFASYFTGNSLPYYITVYLKELNKHFTKVVLLSSQSNLQDSDLQFLKAENIQLMIEKNEGFDFGLWYKAFQQFDISSFEQVALVNDSCILFKPLNEFMNWSFTNKADLQGMTLSDSIAPHVQSYFLILQRSAIKHAAIYFKEHKILANISDVIKTYEVGLSTYLISKGLKIDSYMDNNGYSGEYSPYYHCIDYHIAKGIPLIKKKILFESYRKDELFTLARMNFNISVAYYINLIKMNSKNLVIDLNKLDADKSEILPWLEKIKYQLSVAGINTVRHFRKRKYC